MYLWGFKVLSAYNVQQYTSEEVNTFCIYAFTPVTSLQEACYTGFNGREVCLVNGLTQTWSTKPLLYNNKQVSGCWNILEMNHNPLKYT